MMTHDDALELLAVYALDAVDGAERDALEAHLATCPRCASELDSLRAVTSAMGNVSESASPEIWEKIAGRLDGAPVTSSPPVPFTLTPARRSTRTPRRFVARVASLAAVLAIGLLGFGLLHANSQVAQLRGSLANAQRGALAAAERDPGHRDVSLLDDHGAVVVRVVLLDGRGYVASTKLTSLSLSKTYQLWGIFHGVPVSIGLLGPSPHSVEFAVAGALAPSKIALTVEPAGGSPTPTTPIVAAGAVSA